MADSYFIATEFKFQALVKAELAGARAGHGPIATAHEGYAVILEELDEFWEEVRKKRKDRDPHLMLHELVQLAAMVQRTAEDLELVEGGRP